MKPNTVTTPQIKTLDNVKAICRVCKNEFEAKRFFLHETIVAETVCVHCQFVLDARQRDWVEKCPREFCTPLEGGNTIIERMDSENPQWRKILDWRYGAKGLLVRGISGRCKTRAIWRLLRIQYDKGRSIIALTSGQFDRGCRDAAGRFTLTGWVNRHAQADILFIDDLGKGAWTQATEATFFDLVDQRTRECKPLIVTTNDTAESLAARLSDDRAEPLIRRLKDYCTTITL